MRIALLYPPPWKIPETGEAPDALGEGPPAEYVDGDLDGECGRGSALDAGRRQ